MRLFAHLQVQLDPWEVDYGAEIPIDAADSVDQDVVDLGVEQRGEWVAVQPLHVDRAPALVFVDGVRRLDARLIIRDAERIVAGALGSYGVGSVLVADGCATWGELIVDRLAVTGAGVALPTAVPVTPAAVYRPVSVADTAADAPLRAIHNEMRQCEARVAQAQAATGRVVIVDGPLAFDVPSHGRAVGYIKSIHRLYLPPERLSFLGALAPGSRTPLFAVRSSQRVARYSWFMRLAQPAPGESSYAGLARLEVAQTVGVAEARTLADLTAANLPGFAPHRGRDPRAPQNLLPIGALEGRLRHALGDQRLLRRHVQTLIAREVPHG
jgi:hypothetical protein